METKRNFSVPQKFIRGQVWMIAEPKEISELKVKLGDRTQCFTRPYIIMNCQQSLDDGDYIINVIPISSKTKVVTDQDILFYNRQGELNKIICSQIMTKDIKDVLGYLYTMPVDIMQAVDELVASRVGLQGEVKLLESKIKDLEKEIEKLKDKGASYITKHHRVDYNYEVSSVEKIEPAEENNKSVTVRKTRKTGNTKYKKWTERAVKEYFLFYSQNKKNKDIIMKKYNLKNRQAIYDLNYKLKRRYPELAI